MEAASGALPDSCYSGWSIASYIIEIPSLHWRYEEIYRQIKVCECMVEKRSIFIGWKLNLSFVIENVDIFLVHTLKRLTFG